MKKIVKNGFIFIILGLVIGVYYREFTKFKGFTDFTVLRYTHGHAILFGFLIPVALAYLINNVKREDIFRAKNWSVYYIGVIITLIAMLWRGTLQVLQTPLSTGLDKSISGIAGLGHILLGISLILIMSKIVKEYKAQ